ncbi:Calmodulin [Balamuthia mandrillaris]
MATSNDEIQEAFRCFDTDNDGKLAVAEIGTVIRALGKAPLQSEVEKMEEEAGDGPIDFQTFLKFYNRKMKKPSDLERDMRDAFKALDDSGSGTLTAAELRMLLGSLGEPISGEEVDSLLKCVPMDNEGNLSYEELVDLLIK